MGEGDTMVVAAFDFDGTMTKRDSIVPFLRAVVGRRRLLRELPRLSPAVAGHALHLVSNETIKEVLFRRLLSGMPEDDLLARARRFAHEDLPGLVRADALARLRWHQRQGHYCMLVTASPEAYVKPWADQAGFDHVIATRLEVDRGGHITGRLLGANCYGPEKARRVIAFLGDGRPHRLYAYGDSRGDRELLACAHHAYYRVMPMASEAATDTARRRDHR